MERLGNGDLTRGLIFVVHHLEIFLYPHLGFLIVWYVQLLTPVYCRPTMILSSSSEINRNLIMCPFWSLFNICCDEENGRAPFYCCFATYKVT